jgi:hypothetical protein
MATTWHPYLASGWMPVSDEALELGMWNLVWKYIIHVHTYSGWNGNGSRFGAVGTVTLLRAGRPKDRGPIPGRGKTFLPPSLLSNGYRGPFPEDKATGTSNSPLTSILCWSQECVELYLHSPYLDERRSVLLEATEKGITDRAHWGKLPSSRGNLVYFMG